ncbi:uncharacterized protein LOC121368091 [Gigantopelta aegis]|uniref:uncharacterized protein LOC121368091 n=1 Tax=Gigantopelta aegis TaxID=1735272 RepID=UPI001B88B133|nr:uncharacterized protein LOC121368091 [Gigantopelta aegis]
MGKTAVERQRERRLRLKQDVREYNKYKKRDRERKNAARKNLTPGELKKLRERTLTAVKKYRAGDVTDGTQQLQCYKYGTSASINKAKSRVLKALPKSLRKRATVLKALACDILDVHVVNQPSRILPQETVDTVLAFYQNDAFSRVMPGKADCITIKNSNGEKIKKQKRHLTMTLSEAYCCFKADHPQINIGKSKFAKLSPKWVFLSSQMPHNVCGCRYHENVFLLEDSTFKWYQWVEENGFLQKAMTTDAFDELAGQLPKFFWH